VIPTPTTTTTATEGGSGPGPVALAHDYLLAPRGAERTFAAIAECWPDAAIHTVAYSEAGTEGWFAGRELHTSPLQRIRVSQRWFRSLLPLYPWAVGTLHPDAPVVVSSSSGFAHGVRVPESALHVCYCHTPFRYAWHERERALAEVRAPLRPVLSRQLDRIRAWDLRAAARVDHYLANSELTRARIADAYGRDAEVLHPPVAVDRFADLAPEAAGYFLIVGELVAHKRAEVALEAARLAGARIKVVGSGPEARRLQADHGDHAEFLGRVPDGELARLYAGALALVVPNVEEFGIAAVEVQAAGRPVLALGSGGALETVVDGQTGALVPAPGGAPAFAEAMREVDFTRFEAGALRRNASRFSPKRFRERLRGIVERVAAR
jgi:glycosyltransferase involved in cell wall biosynthesis